MSLHWIDFLILGIISLSIITGLFRGFIKEIVALFVWAVGLSTGFLYSGKLEVVFSSFLHDRTMRVIAAFLSILLVILIIGAILNRIISIILQRSGLSSTDRLLGMGFGLVRGLFSVTLLIVAINMTNIADTVHYSRQSKLYVKFSPLVNYMKKHIPNFITHSEEIAINKQELPEKIEEITINTQEVPIKQDVPIKTEIV